MTSVDHQYFHNFSIKGISPQRPELPVTTYEDLNKQLQDRVRRLCNTFGAGVSHEIAMLKNRFNTSRQFRNEELTGCVQRFEDLLVDLEIIQQNNVVTRLSLQNPLARAGVGCLYSGKAG